MKNNCINCGWARKAYVDDWVGCGYYTNQLIKAKYVTENEFCNNEWNNNEFAPKEFAVGYAYPLKMPNNKSTHWSSARTASEGIMHNGWLLTKIEDYCNHFVS